MWAGCQTRQATVPGLGSETLGPGYLVQVAIDSIDPWYVIYVDREWGGSDRQAEA